MNSLQPIRLSMACVELFSESANPLTKMTGYPASDKSEMFHELTYFQLQINYIYNTLFNEERI
jgi:hypothetical protein